MRCVIPGRGIKAFGKAIFCLAKLGDELYIEAQSNGLALKTVNNARSAYSCFLFHRSFFLSYNEGGALSVGGASSETDRKDILKCKISNKSLMSVFKSLPTLEKTVDHCRMRLDEEDNKLIFIFHCRHGVIKTHNLGYQETDVIQAVFSKEHSINHLVLPARILSEVMANFPNTLDEVTLTAESAGVRLRNFIDEESDEVRVSLTEISLMPAEFDKYRIGVDASLTFCLKELRALLHFTDSISHPLSLKFQTAGKPIVISIEDDKDYQADLVLATLLDNSTPYQSTQTSATDVSSITNTTATTATLQVDHTSTTKQRSRQPRAVQNTEADKHKLGEPIRDGKGSKQVVSNMKTSDVEIITNRKSTTKSSFPTGSQFRQLNSNRNSSSSKIPLASHVPLPPTDTDFMDTDAVYRSSAIPAASRTDDDDVMEALFGEDDMDGVAEDGSMFGFDQERTAIHEKNECLSQQRPLTSETEEHQQVDIEHVRALQPTMNTNTNLLQHESELRSINTLDDSSFLPSTPPSKRFKPTSVLFGMDIFSTKYDDSEILAPASEDEGD